MGDRSLEYDGAFYRPIGDFMRQTYLDWPFTKGTQQEVDFLLDLLKLPENAKILDVGCGVGRHSLELARRGYAVTGIDISEGMIDVAREVAKRESLNPTFIVTDARRIEFDSTFDAAICLCEGAFGLAGGIENHLEILRRVHRALRAGAPFVLTAINALSAARGPAPARFDAYTCTSTETITVTSPAGEQRQAQIWTTAFTYPQLALMFQMEGFEVQVGYGCEAGNFQRKRLTVDDIEIMILARKG